MSALESRPALHALLYARRNYHIRVPHPLPPPFIYFIYAPPPPEFRSIRSSLSIVRSWRIENSRSVLPIGFIFISFHLCCLHGISNFFLSFRIFTRMKILEFGFYYPPVSLFVFRVYRCRCFLSCFWCNNSRDSQSQEIIFLKKNKEKLLLFIRIMINFLS